MGQNIQKTLSCVDCSGTRVVTLEDQESSCCLKGKDFKSLEDYSEKEDEITVFESPVKVKRKRLYKGAQVRGLSGKKNIIDKVNTRLFTGSDQRILDVRTSGDLREKKCDDFPGSEISTPSIITYGNRYRTYSSNLSPISVNIVETIRKDSFNSCGNV